jgi:hydroxyacylglutathione hydrolase
VILRQFLHDDPIAASYLIGCGGQGASAIVVPVGDPASYLAASAAAGMRIRWVVDTHVHADHLSAGRALAAAAGADYALFHAVDAAYPYHGVRDGDGVEGGNVVLRVLHSPGHTPEHISLLVIDRTRSPEPWCDVPPAPPRAAETRSTNLGRAGAVRSR